MKVIENDIRIAGMFRTCLYTSCETPYEISTFPACPDYKSRCSPAGLESKANPCCLSSIVSRAYNPSVHISRARLLPWGSSRSYRDFERDTWARRCHWLCVPQVPTSFENIQTFLLISRAPFFKYV